MGGPFPRIDWALLMTQIRSFSRFLSRVGIWVMLRAHRCGRIRPCGPGAKYVELVIVNASRSPLPPEFLGTSPEENKLMCWYFYSNALEMIAGYIFLDFQAAMPNSTFFVSCWPTRNHIGRTTRKFQPSYEIFRRWCQGLFRPQVPRTPAYTSQLLTLDQHRANNQWIGRLIKSSQL